MITNRPRNRQDLANMIDHTNLSPAVTEEGIRDTFTEAKTYGFRGVCIPPYWVPFAHQHLHDTEIKIDTVVGFPLGYLPLEMKLAEVKWVVANGTDEVDMVFNLSAFKSRRKRVVRTEIKEINDFVGPKIIKVIICTPYLTEEEIRCASQLVIECGADVVKTCTGFGPRGATVKDVEIIRESIGQRGKIKAAGGIGDAQKALSMIEAGADIIGASSGVNIVETFNKDNS